jgi:hypothetical protein
MGGKYKNILWGGYVHQQLNYKAAIFIVLGYHQYPAIWLNVPIPPFL